MRTELEIRAVLKNLIEIDETVHKKGKKPSIWCCCSKIKMLEWVLGEE